VGLVALNALLVQTTYQMQSIQKEVGDLTDQQRLLNDEVARDSSPDRVAGWAREHGMVAPLPGDIVILPVPGVAAASAGARP
jgi:cell division protein FtsL